MLPDYVLASTVPVPRLWNFYPTLEAAQADTARAERSADLFGNCTYTPMTYDAYKAAERAHYLADPLRRITPEQYGYALNVLPPLDWGTYAGVNLFLMSEFQASTYTHQYAAYHGRYYCKLVDASDCGTWINAAMIATYEKEHAHGL